MEYFDIVDEDNNLTGKTEEREIVHTTGLWHREVAVWVINEKGELLLQKRSASKKQAPNKWALCAGHIDAGETPENSIVREIEEEIGLKVTIDDLEPIGVIKKEMNLGNGQYNNNFQYMYILKTNKKIEEYKIQYEELSELKYITLAELKMILETKDSDYTFSEHIYMQDIIKKLEEIINKM